MVKTLRVLLIIYAVVLILSGLMSIFSSEQGAEALFGVTSVSDFARFAWAALGTIYIAAAIWLLFAATDPSRHINWVRFVITKAALFIATMVYAEIVGWIDLSLAGWSLLIADAILFILFLIAYPWRASQRGD
jgi:hypothetical protein